MRSNQGRKNMKKPSKGSGLNPCMQSDMSQLGIPSEFTRDPTHIPESAMSAFQEELDYYNCEMTSGATSFVASDNEFPSSIIQAHSLSATNYVPTTFMGDFISPSIIQATSSLMVNQYPGILAHAMAPWGVDAVPPTNLPSTSGPTTLSYPSSDALPLCAATDAHTMIAPICLPTPLSSHYPQRLPAETIQQISQLRRPNLYPVISSGIRRVFAYGPRRPSETERGAFVNIGVIRTGADREITTRRPTRRMLPPSPQVQALPLPQPSEDTTRTVSETEVARLDTTRRMLPPSHIQSLPSQQSSVAVTRTISEIEMGQLNKVVHEAKHGMRRRLIRRNPFPSQTEALSFAEDALTDAVSSLIGDFEYGVDRTQDGKIVTQVVRVAEAVRTLFKNVARAQVPIAYNLNPTSPLNPDQVRRAVRSRVEHLLQDYNFLYTDDLPREFGHCALTHSLLSSVWTMPGAIAKSLDMRDMATFNGLVALAGAALNSVLYEYREGQLSTIEFSSTSAGKHYTEITRLINSMLQNEEQRSRYETYYNNVVLLGSSFHGT
ncbi:hypothetical protein EDD17DRAFT_1525466 [Pisolithus thermaeus]|nr:hypothetical protein EDD17DRAFT_1525466 [Pisolithus thermaeus]